MLLSRQVWCTSTLGRSILTRSCRFSSIPVKRTISTSPIFEENTGPISKFPDIVYAYLRGPIPYQAGLDLQDSLVTRRLEAKEILNSPESLSRLSNVQIDRYRRIYSTDVLLLLQHSPVYTTGRRDNNDPQSTQSEGERLRKLGADYFVTKRGGQTTYHGPGQLVGYPIFDLTAMDMRTRTFVCLLEQFLNQFLNSRLGVNTVKSDHVGIFTSPTDKIASIGLQLRHRITSHGFAVNIQDSVLPWFNNIVACGLDDVHAISAESIRTQQSLPPISVDQAVLPAIDVFADVFQRSLRPAVDTDDPSLLELIQNAENYASSTESS